MTMEPAVGLTHTRAGIAGVRAVLADADLDLPVPGCPGWTLTDLGQHLGELHRWVVGAVVEGHPDTVTPPGPRDRAELLAWYDEGAGALLDILAAADPDAPCWAFGPKPTTVRFWLRRQAHEHAVHAVDAAAATGRPPVLDPALALDGVDEVVRMFFPRQVRLGRIPALTRSLAVRADGSGDGSGDGDGWLLAGDGTDAGTDAAGPAEATVSGPAEALYLLLWRRTGLDDPRLALSGDRAAAVAVLGTAIVP